MIQRCAMAAQRPDHIVPPPQLSTYVRTTTTLKHIIQCVYLVDYAVQYFNSLVILCVLLYRCWRWKWIQCPQNIYLHTQFTQIALQLFYSIKIIILRIDNNKYFPYVLRSWCRVNRIHALRANICQLSKILPP